MILLRQLTAPEVPGLEPLITNFFNEGNIHGKFDPKYSAKVLQSQIEAGTGFVIVGGDPICGGISGLMYEDIATGEKCCAEWFWYVNKEFRGTSLGLKLLNAYEQEAKKRKAVRMLMMHICQGKEHDSQFKRIYESRGYRMKEQIFVKEII